MARLYPTEIAYRKMGVSKATFFRLLQKARDDGYAEKIEPRSSKDGRERLYALSQLLWLTKHYRKGQQLLPDEEVFVTAEEQRREMERLRQDVEALNEHVIQLSVFLGLQDSAVTQEGLLQYMVRQEVGRQIQMFEAQIRNRVVAGVAELLPAALEDRLRQEIEEQVAIAFRHVRLEFVPRSLLPPPADS